MRCSIQQKFIFSRNHLGNPEFNTNLKKNLNLESQNFYVLDFQKFFLKIYSAFFNGNYSNILLKF